MIRHAFTMEINSGSAEEYKRRHDEIWPEMARVLKEVGASNYSIFRGGTTLFAYVEFRDEEQWNKLSENPIVRKWWDYMADIMKVNPDNSPVSRALEQVFYMP